jgi:hypothetical protein
MNVFYLDREPKACAEYHCDKHVVKMIIEYAQLMSTAHRVLDGHEDIEQRYVQGSLPARWRKVKVWNHPNAEYNTGLMKASHINHPSAVWTRKSKENYIWLNRMWNYLLLEYTHRYGKRHACSKYMDVLYAWPQNIPEGAFTEPPPAMPDYCKVTGNSIASYHKYYINEKVRFARWTKREVPAWFKEGSLNRMVEINEELGLYKDAYIQLPA